MDRKIESLLTEIERVGCELEGLSEAFGYLREGMENEGYQNRERIDEVRAVSFARRFPMYLAVYDVLTGGLKDMAEELYSRCAQIRAAAPRALAEK